MVTQELMVLTARRDSPADFKKHIDTIRRVLREARHNAVDGVISKAFADQYIDKIFAAPEEDGSMRLPIKLFTGETTDKYLQNLGSRTGHAFKTKRTVHGTVLFYVRIRRSSRSRA